MCYTLNHANGQQVNVSGQIAEMLVDAKEVYDRTGGAYDLTVYPLIVRWGFDHGRYYIPAPEEISADLKLLCMDKMNISKFPTSGTYAVTFPEYGSLTFASCARGCAAKYAVDAMRKNGVTSGIVSLAGNIQTLGKKPDGTNWSVGITDPKNPSGYLGILSVGEAAIVTTGSFQQYMPTNPNYHHIFNTSSGYPTSNGLLSVTIICEDGTYADCLVCYHRVQGVLVGGRIDSDRLNAKLTAGTDYSHSYFAAVGDKDFLEHILHLYFKDLCLFDSEGYLR